MLLGNTLRDLRNEKNLSQKQLAKRWGSTPLPLLYTKLGIGFHLYNGLLIYHVH